MCENFFVCGNYAQHENGWEQKRISKWITHQFFTYTLSFSIAKIKAIRFEMIFDSWEESDMFHIEIKKNLFEKMLY
jgi:hypothetical protein